MTAEYEKRLQDFDKYISTMTTEEYKDYIAAKYHGIEDTVTGNATITKGMSTENHTYTKAYKQRLKQFILKNRSRVKYYYTNP